MSDVNGPRGGIDKRCQVQLMTDGAGSVVVASEANDWRTALDKALARATLLLMRRWRRVSLIGVMEPGMIGVMEPVSEG